MVLKGLQSLLYYPKPVDLFLAKMKLFERAMEVCSSADVQFAYMSWD